MCIIETLYACGTVLQQRVFPTEACDCDDVVEDTVRIDEGCGWCTPVKQRLEV